MDQLVVVVAVVVVVVFVTFSTKRRDLLHHTIKDDLRLVIGACLSIVISMYFQK